LQLRPQKSEQEFRGELCTFGGRLEKRGFITATEGNLSVRLADNRILITPGGARKCELSENEIIIVDMDGGKISGCGKPSSELGMHLLFYRQRNDVQAVCHAHPTTATGFAAARRALDEALHSEVVIALGAIPLVDYAPPGSQELVSALAPFVIRHDAMLLANHGVVTCGPDLRTAFHRMELVEHFARIVLVANLLGGPARFSRREVDALLAARSRYGVEGPPEVARPLAAEDVAGEAISSEDQIKLTHRELEALIAEAITRTQSH
jgi:L-fuculose-phosphate aldolase